MVNLIGVIHIVTFTKGSKLQNNGYWYNDYGAFKLNSYSKRNNIGKFAVNKSFNKFLHQA